MGNSPVANGVIPSLSADKLAAITLAERDRYWMRHALALAELAAKNNEVPIGAVIVCNNQLVSEGFNQVIGSNDPTAHAEIVAVRNAAKALQNYRLVNCTLYVTLEPCSMCAGALVHSRLERLVYGAKEPKAGAIQSKSQLLDADYVNWQIEHLGGVEGEEAARVLSSFFKRRREEKRQEKNRISSQSIDKA